jgi:hypothetical protein
VGTFDNIPEALRYAIYGLADQGHGYIVNVRGPKEIERSHAAAIQVVPATFVYQDGDLGLAIHMPFDPSSGMFGELVRFLDTQGNELFDEYTHDGIPIFVINLGDDIGLATRVVEYMLERVYEYPPGTTFQCEVSDEGPAGDDEDEELADE